MPEQIYEMAVEVRVRFAASLYTEAKGRAFKTYRWLSVLTGPACGCEVVIGRASMPKIVDEGRTSLPRLTESETAVVDGGGWPVRDPVERH